MKAVRKFLFLLIFLLTSPTWGAEPIGKVIDLVGESWITHSDQKTVIAFLNQGISLGDVVKTTRSGSVKILFVDDTVLTVKEFSSVLLSEFLFNPSKKERKVTLNASYGTIRTLIGKFFGKEQPIEIRTPTAVAGIRGTDLGIQIGLKSSTFYCFLCETDILSVYNIDFPEKAVTLDSGESIEILKLKAAAQENIIPIPKDILEKKEFIFDVPQGTTATSIETLSKKLAKEVLGAGVLQMAAIEPALQQLLVEKVQTIQKQETLLQETIPATADTKTTVNPGGSLSSTSPQAKITLTIPSH